MKPETIKAILAMGDVHGSAFNEILAYYGIEDKDLGRITEEQAQDWLRQKGGDNLGHSDNTCN
jgi:hypothetical protein